MKLAGAVAAVVMTVTMGVVAVITRGSPGSTALNAVSGQAAPTTARPAGDGHPDAAITGAVGSSGPSVGGGPAAVQAITLPTHPSAEDVQRILAGITAEIMATPASTAITTPLTKAQVEQEVRSKLAQLGINF